MAKKYHKNFDTPLSEAVDILVTFVNLPLCIISVSMSTYCTSVQI